jgi:hypothetical protein
MASHHLAIPARRLSTVARAPQARANDSGEGGSPARRNSSSALAKAATCSSRATTAGGSLENRARN